MLIYQGVVVNNRMMFTSLRLADPNIIALGRGGETNPQVLPLKNLVYS